MEIGKNIFEILKKIAIVLCPTVIALARSIRLDLDETYKIELQI